MSKPRGYVVWQGPSEIDGKPIVLIATGFQSSKNVKTGAMIQTYILRADIPPIEAMQSGEDASICGDCPHKPSENGTCYVRVDTGPNMVYKAFKRGSYTVPSMPSVTRLAMMQKTLRLGTYGDPCAVPFSVWANLLVHTIGHTGYTHQWKQERFSAFKAICMASCDNLDEDTRAKRLGWRTFTIVPKGLGATVAGSFLCPASAEAGKVLTCTDCLACGGTTSHNKASVYIPVHGVAFKQTRFNALIQIGGVV